MQTIKQKLIEGEGYVILEQILTESITSPALQKHSSTSMVRASTVDLQYAEKENCKLLNNIAVYWSDTQIDSDCTKIIHAFLIPFIKSVSNTLDLYSSDYVTIVSNTEYCNPHIDTPHRFKKYNFDNRLLGIQCIVALEDMTIENGVTGLVPYSQKRDFDIVDCYSGKYTRWFKENAKQFDLSRGSVLMYNCRVLHSSMSNKSNNNRTALAINYLDNSLIDEVRVIDNIWTSNGK